MKLRQKLAAVLAATMVVTAVPVVTMAASTNGVTKVVTVAKNTEFFEATTASGLKIDAKDATAGEVFFLELENAEWLAATDNIILDDANVTVTRTGSKTATVKINKDAAVFNIPMLVKVTGGEAAVTVVSENSSVTGGKYIFANTPESDKAVTVTVDGGNTFYTEGTIKNIKIEETVVNSLKDGATIEIALNSDEFEFKSADVTATGSRGFASDVDVTAKFENKDYGVLVVEIAPTTSASNSRGVITLEGITVQAVKSVKNPTVGDLTVDISSSSMTDVSDVKAATIAEYGSTLKVKDDKVVEIVAGKAKDVEFTLQEAIEDSMSVGRTVDFTLSNGFFGAEDEAGLIKVNGTAVSKDDYIVEKVDGVKRVVGFTHTVKAEDKTDKKVKLVVTGKVNTIVGTEEEITVTAEGRAMTEEVTATIVTVAPNFKVEAKGAKLEVGVKGQKGGEIVITEEKAGAFAKNDVITITLAEDKGINFTDKPEVEVTGDMKVDTTFVAATSDAAAKIELKVTRTSKEAGTITVKDIPVTIDKTVADGAYDAKLTVEGYTGTVKAEGFFTIGEGIATRVETTITNGATEMVVNGAKVALDAPAFLENGKMMVPLRAVAEAFGIPSKDIVYNAGEIVVFANGRTVALTIGSTDAYVNGAKMTLANPAKLVNDRTTVPVGDLARLLGLSVEWDNTTKTATFAN